MKSFALQKMKSSFTWWNLKCRHFRWNKNPTNLPNQRFGVGTRNRGVRGTLRRSAKVALLAWLFPAVRGNVGLPTKGTDAVSVASQFSLFLPAGAYPASATGSGRVKSFNLLLFLSRYWLLFSPNSSRFTAVKLRRILQKHLITNRLRNAQQFWKSRFLFRQRNEQMAYIRIPLWISAA